MTHVYYSDIDLRIDEEAKTIIINPKGERFYFVKCEEMGSIFRDAIVRFDSEEERYEIEGNQSLYSEHRGSSFSYEKMLCLHPKELIKKHSFLGIEWYWVGGVMKREIRTVYSCRHKQYLIQERSAIMSCTVNDLP
jgi:hypothetical protein